MALYEEDDVIEITSNSGDENLVLEEPRREDGLHLLHEFITVCKPLLRSNQQNAINKLLRDKFNEAKESYTQSEDFRCFMREHISDLQLKRRSVYVHIQDVKTALMRASNTRRVNLTTVKVEKIEDGEPAVKKEVAEKADSHREENVAMNGRGDAETDIQLAVQEKVKNTAKNKDTAKNKESTKNKDAAKNVRDKTVAKLCPKEDLERADPKANEDVTKNGSTGKTEMNPVLAKEIAERADQQDNEDIALNGRDNKVEGKPANENDVGGEDQQEDDDVGKGRVDDVRVGVAQEACSQSEDLLMTCETITNDHAMDQNVPNEEEPVKESNTTSLNAVAGPSTDSPRDDSTKMLDVRASSHEVPRIKDSDRKSKPKDKGKGSKKQIQKLEKVLHSLDKAIKKLQERELTLDEMNESDSIHIQEYQLRRRFVKVYSMLCEKNGCSPSTGRVIEQRMRYEGTRFPEINRRLEKLVNKKDFFPDFPDIHAAVTRTSKKKDLGLDKRKIQSIAREAFEDLGGKLQKRRQQDFLLNFSSHSTLDFINARDSVDKDPELKRKLVENRALAKQNLRQVEDSFVKKQEECEKKGESLDASEHSASDAPPESPSEDEEEEVERPSKKPRLDRDEDLGGKDNADADLTDNRQIFETNDQEVIDIQDINPSIPDQTSAPETNSTQNSHPRYVHVRAFSNGPLNTNNNAAKITQAVSATTWKERDPLSFDTPEQAVKSLKFDRPAVPSPSLPLLITNVCSLSEHAGFFPGPGQKAWDEGKATIARVVDDGSGGILIGPPSQQRIMVVKSGKSVELQTSSPITLSFEDRDIKSSMQPPAKEISVPTPSPPPSVTSTQPELDASPDVEEVVVKTEGAHASQTKDRLEAVITSLTKKKQVSYTQSQARPAWVNQRVVPDTGRQSPSGYVRCNHCMKTLKESERNKHSCRAYRWFSNSNVQSRPPLKSKETVSFVHLPDKATVNPTGPVRNPKITSKSQSAQDKVFNIRNTKSFPQIKTSPKWQPSSRRLNLPSRVGAQDQKACPRRLAYINRAPARNAGDDADSDVVIISDSEMETGEKSGNRSESPDVICISDSD